MQTMPRNMQFLVCHSNQAYEVVQPSGSGPVYIDMLVQERRTCSALAIELGLSCTNIDIKNQTLSSLSL